MTNLAGDLAIAISTWRIWEELVVADLRRFRHLPWNEDYNTSSIDKKEEIYYSNNGLQWKVALLTIELDKALYPTADNLEICIYIYCRLNSIAIENKNHELKSN